MVWHFKMKILIILVASILAVNAVKVSEDERVLGGSYATNGQYPFNAAIHYKKLFLCSGAFIVNGALTSPYIITTADCIYAYQSGTELTGLSVKLGSVKSAHEGTFFEYSVGSVKIHDLYDPYLLSDVHNRDFVIHLNNIAVITLNMSVIITPTVSPIALPTTGSPPIAVNALLTLVGWGQQHGLVNDLLQSVALTTIDVQKCILISGGSPSVGTANHLCTDAHDPVNNRPEGACTTDHGGPLILLGPTPILHGLVSWADCEWENAGVRPTIYTSILGHLPWILDAT